MPLRYRTRQLAGWCFGTFFVFPYIENNHPKLTFIFFRGVGIPRFAARDAPRFCVCASTAYLSGLGTIQPTGAFCHWYPPPCSLSFHRLTLFGLVPQYTFLSCCICYHFFRSLTLSAPVVGTRTSQAYIGVPAP